MKRNPLEDLPAHSSSDDEEVESSAEEEEEDVPKPPSPSAAAKQAENESESETESETEPEQPANKKKDNAPPPVALSLPAKSRTKRPSEGSSKETANSKRPKKIGGDDGKKPGAIQRLWTEEDEIAVLQGMIDFKNDTGKSPYEDLNVYYDYMKKSISFEVSKSQFLVKIRNLRKKYIGKEKASYTKPHDHKSYSLCQYIWGSDGMAGASKKKTVVADDDERDVETVAAKKGWFENSFLVKEIAGLVVDELSVKQLWDLVSMENKKKLGEKFKLLQAKEFELKAKEFEFMLEKNEVVREVTAVIAEAAKNH